MKTSKVLAVIVACLPAASLVPSQALFSAGLASVEELASTKIDGAIAYVPVEGDGSENAGWTDAADVSGDAAEDPEETIPECPPDDSQAELVESVLAEQESDDSVILDESVDTQSITYEDDAILATATAPVGVLPVGTSLSVMEVLPTDADTADAYKKKLKDGAGNDNSKYLVIFTDGKNHLNVQVGEGVVENTMIYELPAAGGPGVYPFLLVGAFVSTFMAWAVRDKHRRYATASRRFALAGVIEGGD